MAKVFYCVKIDSSSFPSAVHLTLKESREWCQLHQYIDVDGRIVAISNDGDTLAFYSIEE